MLQYFILCFWATATPAGINLGLTHPQVKPSVASPVDQVLSSAQRYLNAREGQKAYNLVAAATKKAKVEQQPRLWLMQAKAAVVLQRNTEALAIGSAALRVFRKQNDVRNELTTLLVLIEAEKSFRRETEARYVAKFCPIVDQGNMLVEFVRLSEAFTFIDATRANEAIRFGEIHSLPRVTVFGKFYKASCLVSSASYDQAKVELTDVIAALPPFAVDRSTKRILAGSFYLLGLTQHYLGDLTSAEKCYKKSYNIFLQILILIM